MLEFKTDLAAAMHLAKEGRLEEFVGREKQIPRGGNYKKTLDALYREFGITVARREGWRCSCGHPVHFPHPVDIYKGLPA